MKRIVCNLLTDVAFAVLRRVYGILERLMIGIQTGIENCNDHALAGVVGILHNIATDGRHAVCQLCLVYRLDQPINLRHISVLHTGYILNRFQILIISLDRQTVEYGRILIANLCVVQRGVDLTLDGLAGAFQPTLGRLRCAAVQKIRYTGILCDLPVIQQRRIFQLHDDADAVVRCRHGCTDPLAVVRPEQCRCRIAQLYCSGRYTGQQHRCGKKSRAPSPE